MDAPVVTMKQLLEAGVHFGHQTRRWNPKMRRFIFGERNGIYIIDLQQTLARIETAYSFVRDLVADGGNILFIGTKKQAQDPIQSYAEKCGMPYINERWLGGMLTNFETIAKRVQKMQEYQRMRAAGDFEAMPKKEALLIGRELEKLERNLKGIREMTKLPEAVFILDTKKEHIGVTEANKLGIPIVAVVDTNCDPDLIQYVIPGNDDAIRAGTLMCRIIADAVEEGRLIASKRGGGSRPAAGRPHGRGRRAHRRAAGRGPPPGRAAGPRARGPTGGDAGRGARRSRAVEPEPVAPRTCARRRPGDSRCRDKPAEADGPRPRVDRDRNHPRGVVISMAEFGAKDVKALRDATGAGMMDAKRALEENDGDMEKAGQVAARAGHHEVRRTGRPRELARRGRRRVRSERRGVRRAEVRDRLHREVDRLHRARPEAGRRRARRRRQGRSTSTRTRSTTSSSPRRRTSRSARSCASRPATATCSTPTCTARTVAASTR